VPVERQADAVTITGPAPACRAIAAAVEVLALVADIVSIGRATRCEAPTASPGRTGTGPVQG
jgi:hypothetical protein